MDNDSYQGGYDLTRHLIELGHDRIAFIFRHLDWEDPNQTARISGWKNAMLEAGTSPQLLEELLLQANRPITDLPVKEMGITALMANDDIMAMACLCYCYDKNIRVPDDLTVTGFGNMKSCEFFSPPLTTVDQKTFTVGYEAARHAAELATGKLKELPQMVVPTELVLRKSSSARSFASDLNFA